MDKNTVREDWGGDCGAVTPIKRGIPCARAAQSSATTSTYDFKYRAFLLVLLVLALVLLFVFYPRAPASSSLSNRAYREKGEMSSKSNGTRPGVIGSTNNSRVKDRTQSKVLGSKQQKNIQASPNISGSIQANPSISKSIQASPSISGSIIPKPTLGGDNPVLQGYCVDIYGDCRRPNEAPIQYTCPPNYYLDTRIPPLVCVFPGKPNCGQGGGSPDGGILCPSTPTNNEICCRPNVCSCVHGIAFPKGSCPALNGSEYCMSCFAGYRLNTTSANRIRCVDINECLEHTDDCNVNATCTNTEGSFTCECNRGYMGDGVNCTDINECADKTDNCDPGNATCTNTQGSFTCQGDGSMASKVLVNTTTNVG
eukprot:gb/GEZN01009551.1/.p1 GENE.gb/GEZN01009551.1/~~gb/GEZN01009551.1/.p1  ORF type:complete len:368 (+),score=25.18 gb/GEZN01009551.1/:1-1104(+)